MAASFLGYLIVSVWFSLLPNYGAIPVLDVRSFAPTLSLGLLYGILLLALFALYFLLYREVYRGDFPLRLGQITAVTILLAAPLLVTYPINANDVFRYVVRGRISSVYGGNPFTDAPDDFAGDRYVEYSGEWREATSPYGPLWERLASRLAAVAGENLLLAVLLFKILGLFAVLAAAALLWLLLAPVESRPRRGALTLLWAWNPAILLTFVANAHNDALMIACLLLGWWVIRRGHSGPGLLLSLLAPLIKPIALLAVPFLFVDSLRETQDWRQRIVLVLWFVLGGALLTWLAFLPYGGPLVLIPRLLEEAGGGASFSPFTLLFLIADNYGWRLPFTRIVAALPVLFLVYFAWLLGSTWRGRSAENAIPRAYAGYLAQALNFRIWYASWPFPWLILDAKSAAPVSVRALDTGLWFLMTTQLSVLIYGHFRFELFAGELLPAHLMGVTFVFMVPFLLARVLPITPPTSAAFSTSL